MTKIIALCAILSVVAGSFTNTTYNSNTLKNQDTNSCTCNDGVGGCVGNC